MARSECLYVPQLKCLMESCGICFEKHTYWDGLHTSCGHSFGKVCYDTYQRSKYRKPCPVCNMETPDLIVYVRKA